MAGFQSLDDFMTAINNKVVWVHPRTTKIEGLVAPIDHDSLVSWEMQQRGPLGGRSLSFTVNDDCSHQVLCVMTRRDPVMIRAQEGITPGNVILVCRCCGQVIPTDWVPD